MQNSDYYKQISVEKTSEYEIYFYILHEYLKENNIVLSNKSVVLNEVDGDYLILDYVLKSVWIPKSQIKHEYIIHK
ncbi:hypothetical protein Metev_0166 [Methanohalobium evestigatum Z-7303]|uniref:Uncharacterized protein n=1 Tax=Methanohalobium evestigatum (strain ATCC BAA-1072 / DSM 3721 / NBRC 107634 / OCM 161 / Z-7303) TaxID=644295 RepID=D7E675_METEZ|nr:hypothetical protein [Methanohalobium evestigatum]ADI73097.1 hypothetical protein Metev_0166 [Methanohalobium evestigatum Z-7303]